MTIPNNYRFYKYLAISDEDRKWGIYLTGAGHIHVKNYYEVYYFFLITMVRSIGKRPDSFP